MRSYLVALLALIPPPLHAQTWCQRAITAVPYVITASGYYCADRNLTLPGDSGYAITINASDVTVDLRGYTLSNAGTTESTATGVYGYAGRHGITVRDGRIRGFIYGIRLDGTAMPSSGHLVEDVTIWANYVGVWVEGSGAVVRRCRVLGTGTASLANTTRPIGIRVAWAAGGRVEDNVVAGTLAPVECIGIHVNESPGAVASRNTIANATALPGSYAVWINGVTSPIVLDHNWVVGYETGFQGSGAWKYRDNTMSGVTIPYVGGINAENP